MSGDCCGEGPAYVLGALEPDEAERFREHLASCAVCRDEVAALMPVVGMLPAAAPQHAAPRGLRRRVMAEVHREARVGVRAPRTWRPRLLPALAAVAALAVGLLAGAVLLGSGGSPSQRVVSASVAGVPGARAEIERYGSRAVLYVTGMPPAPRGRVYEVWERAGPRVSPTNSLFNVARDGSATASVPGDLHDVNAVLVTAEPLGGSQTPTSAPVIVARL